jgi:hypothetical protein
MMSTRSDHAQDQLLGAIERQRFRSLIQRRERLDGAIDLPSCADDDPILVANAKRRQHARMDRVNQTLPELIVFRWQNPFTSWSCEIGAS